MVELLDYTSAMSVLLCTPPWWTEGCVSKCVEKRYFGIFVPVGAILASILVFSFRYYRTKFTTTPVTTLGYQPVAADDEGDGNCDGEAGNFVPITTQVSLTRHVQWMEASALALDVAGGVVLITYGGDHGYGGRLLLSVFLFAFASLRLLSASHLALSSRSHSEALYCVQWICLLLMTHRRLVTEPGSLVFWIDLTQLGLFTALVSFHWTASRVPSIHHDGIRNADVDIEDLGTDEKASFLARLSFTWLDPLLWKAFRAGPLDPAVDLYPLNSNINAATVIPQFRIRGSVASSFLKKIYHFLKWDLLQQGAWAALTSVLVFVPPILIKLILEYLEVGSSSPSTGWLYILGLFAASIMASMSDCQCGWAGYKLGAKLRTVLFDQVYTKIMLRRMVGSSSPSNDADAAADTNFTSDGSILNFISGVCNTVSSFLLACVSCS